MLRTLLLFLVLWPLTVLAIPCDCEVRVYSPLTGSHRLLPNALKVYDLEEFSSHGLRNQQLCRRLCLEKFEEDMPVERLSALLLIYSQRLINEGVIGHNCTGPTTLKYPVRVKASLGSMPLGNVEDIIQVVNHEQSCF